MLRMLFIISAGSKLAKSGSNVQRHHVVSSSIHDRGRQIPSMTVLPLNIVVVIVSFMAYILELSVRE